MFESLIARLQNLELPVENEVRSLCNACIDILIQQPNTLSLSPPISICGDIHGQFLDLLHLFQVSGKLPQTQYLFLGDYVDRGHHSTQTILLLLAYKCRYPQKIHLLRGNHESKTLTITYGFYDEVNKKYGNLEVWRMICNVFTYLPVAAVMDGVGTGSSPENHSQRVFAVHGGLSPDLKVLDQIYWLDRVQQLPEKGLLSDLVWSDPDISVLQFTINPRGAGWLFPDDEVKKFCHMNDIRTIVRAHQLVEEGYSYSFGNEGLVTVWSAPNYYYRCGNQAAVMKLSPQESEYKFVQYDASEQNKNLDKNIALEHVLPYFL